jgi:heme/copper-type cytochrome/quinol oxidase subunit 2
MTRLRSCAATARQALTTLAFVFIGGVASVLACPQCFGAQESSLVDGAKLGVLVMVGVTLTVQGAFVAFFLYLRKRAKRMADSDLEAEWLSLQRGSRTS